MRGETTPLAGRNGQRITFQSTPLMRGETAAGDGQGDDQGISIHSPHARGDPDGLGGFETSWAFQSTPLMRGETD